MTARASGVNQRTADTEDRTAYTVDDVRRHSERTSLLAPAERHAAVAATVTHISTVVGALRTLDLGETPPATSLAFPEVLP
jgi:hypothetical protein